MTPPDIIPPNESFNALTQMMRQLERLDERTRDLATRADLESMRKELVARDSLQPQLDHLRTMIERTTLDRESDKKDLSKRLDELQSEQISRNDRMWIRMGQFIAVLAFVLSLFEFLTHLHISP